MLSVILDDDGKSTVKCEGGIETHNLEDAKPETPEDYEAVWSAWERAAHAEESLHLDTLIPLRLNGLKASNRG